MKPIILIHPFQVEAHEEKPFLDAWRAVDQYMRKQAGFIETRLHRSLNYEGFTGFSFVNIALWENIELFRRAISGDNFILMVKDVLKFSCGAGFYEVIESSNA